MTRYCTCTVDGLHLGIGIDEVQEVLREQTVTPVPLSDPSVLGIVNLRGHIVTAIDARRRLGLPARPSGHASASIIIRADDEMVSLVVDAEGDVVDVDGRDVQKVPATVGGALARFLSGAYQLDGTLLLVLDTNRVISVTAN